MSKLKCLKMHPEAVLPKKAHPTDAGYDLVPVSLEKVPGKIAKYIYGFGLAVEIPIGSVGLLFPRSSIHKTDLMLANCVGVIDCGFSGEIKAIFKPKFHPKLRDPTIYLLNMKPIAQLVVVKLATIVEAEFVDSLSDSDRGIKGFGSTDENK